METGGLILIDYDRELLFGVLTLYFLTGFIFTIQVNHALD